MPKKELTIGLVVVGVLVVVYYVRKKGASPAAASTPAATGATTDQFPADGTVGNPSDPYSTDTATGITYGNEAGTGTFSTFGTSSGNVTAPTGTVANGPPFSTNAQWSNWVIAQMLANNPQQDPAALTDALGLYLEGQPISPGQKTLIFDAIAVGGNPPVAGANNYPPNVQTNGATGGGTGGSSSGAGAGIVAGLPGTPLAQGIATLQQNGIILNAVTNSQGVHVNPQANGAATITGGTYYATGQAGDHFANSATLFIN